MSDPHVPAGESSSRRDSSKQTSLGLAGAAALPAARPAGASAAPADMAVRIGLIGCGGRGTGAVLDALGAATKVIYP